MEIRFLGHATVLLTAETGERLLVDPYNPGGFGGKMGYAPIPHEADAVVCSHDHLDHCAVEDLPNRPVRLQGDQVFGPFRIHRHKVFHDEYRGRRRGGAVDMLEIRVDGLTIVHGSDVGHSPGTEIPAGLYRPDVFLVPVGGFYTIGASQAREWYRRLGPKIVVPIHYKTARCGLPIRQRETFLAQMPGGVEMCGPSVELDEGMFSFQHKVVVLEPEL